MKSFFILAAALALGGCNDITAMQDGNPDGMAYAGSAGSVYSAAANPPQAIGTVTYNPDATPMPASDLPTPGASPTGATAPSSVPPAPMRHS
jgi:hypothetical protein